MDEIKKTEQKYHVLTPKTDLQDSIYFNAIDFALKDESVHNLAISGPYGAGKSSIIHSYIHKRKDENASVVCGENQIKDITVTLAHLCPSDEEVADGLKGKKQKIDPNLIQYSILEQLFFHDTGANLPESQFSRIKPLSKWDLGVYVAYIVMFIASVFVWIYRDTLGINSSGCVTVMFFSVLLAYAVYKLFPIIRNLSIRKISLATASIEVSSTQSQSVLNRHLDEILYFFQQTGTNIVVFEDLDRFNNPDLFIKLREINYLINNAKGVEQNVVFIYALRDDMFLNKQRTKFFDFIVPIIPYVDGKNAVDKLYAEMEDGGIDDGLCQVLSYHIGDMRMVYNIINEYQVYKAFKSAEANFDINKLLAIVAYKNCYPKDFAALLEHKGILYDVMTQRNVVISQEQEDINKRLKELDEKARVLQNHQHLSIKALRLEYINALLRSIPDRGARLGAFDEIRNLDEWTEDDLFKKIESSSTINYVYQQVRTRSLGQSAYSYKFQEIEKVVDPEHSYKEREKLIRERGNLEGLLKEIERLREDESYIKECKYMQYLDDGHTIQGKFAFDNYKQYAENADVFTEQIELIEDLLSLDYINENYMEYVSLFHEGTLGKTERRFLIDVMRHNHNPHDYKLDKAAQVVDKLDENLFLETSACWNIDLVDALMLAEAHGQKAENLMRNLSDTDGHLEFIDEYVHRGKQVGLFIEELCDIYTEIWRDIRATTYSEIDKSYLLELILRYARLEQISRIFDKNEEAIANLSDYFSLKDISTERLHEIARTLDVKFSNITNEVALEHREFLLNNDLYVIKPEMLRCVLAVSKEDEQLFRTCNYTYIRNTKQEKLIAYIESHLEEYVNNVLLAMPTNTQEETIHESALLIDEQLSDEEKEKIIAQGKKMWDSVEQWDTLTPELKLKLYEYRRVKVTWENVLMLFELNKPALAEYLSDESVIKELLKLGKPELKSEMRDKWKELQETIVTDKPFEQVDLSLFNCFDSEFNQSVLMHCDAKRIERLIGLGLIKRGMDEYNYLHEIDPTLCMDFLIVNYDDFSPIIDKLNLEDYDVDAILRDEHYLSLSQKLNVLEHVNAKDVVGEYSAMTIIDFLMNLEVGNIEIGEGVKKLIKIVLCYKGVSTLTRVRLFNKYKISTKVDIDEIIASFDRDFVNENGRLYWHTKASSEMYIFCKYLERIGYLSVCKNYGRSKGYITIRY